MTPPVFHRLAGVAAAAASACCLFSTRAGAAPEPPANLGLGLRQIAADETGRSAAAARIAPRRKNPRVQSDAAGRVVVDVRLAPGAVPAEVRARLQALGAKVFAETAPGVSSAARGGILSARLPVAAAAAAAKIPGVQSISLVHRPWRHAGAVTSQGVAPLRTLPALRRGFSGAGIMVGVVSDSFNLTAPHAGLDIVRDDLPGPGNRARRTRPVAVLADGDPGDSSNVDEGRAMLQIVHDVAPNAALAFHAAGDTQTTFADAIRALRESGNCDVIVDDIGFPDEPFFSQGIVEQAVEDVVNSGALAGKKVVYYSAAGNQGDLGLDRTFAPVPDATVRAQGATVDAGNLQLDQVPEALTAGGFFTFGQNGAASVVSQQVTVNGDYAEFALQWDDVFDAARITSDYNLLVFDADGNFLPDLSGTDDNFSTGMAAELVDLPPGSDGSDAVYQLAITRRGGGTGEARHLHYTVDASGGVSGDFLQTDVATISGHSGARSGDAVAAYPFYRLAEPEDFTSFGPVVKHFDADGNRLQTPEVRLQPTVAGPDGVVTTVLHPFFGTSAAAPHLAGVAALLLQAGGGPGSLTPAQIRAALQSTAYPHDLDPFTATAQLSSDTAGTLTLTAHGDTSNFSTIDPEFFSLDFTGASGAQLQALAIDISPAGLAFDPNPVTGLPFTVGAASAGVDTDISAVLLPGILRTRNSRLVLPFNNFPQTGALHFGIDRDVARLHQGGNSADLLARGIVIAKVQPAGNGAPEFLRGVFKNKIGAGYSPADGFGFVNVDAALRWLGH